MLVTKQPVLKRFWYPVVPIANLLDSPKPFELLGQKLVLWLTDDGKPAAAEDRCCHRSAKLSKGIVVDGNIRCPYHGWAFNAEGTCVDVPQLSNRSIPPTYKVKSFHCAEKYGYAWVCLGEPLATIPEIPEVENPAFRAIHQFYEPWNCSGLRVMENSFDNAHPHFVHSKTFGDEQNPVPPPYDLVEETDTGIHVQTTLPVLNPPLHQKHLNMEQPTTVQTMDMNWFMPFTCKLQLTYPNGLTYIIVAAATPINDSMSQFIQFCLRNDTEVEAKASDIIAFDRAVTYEDKAILETTDYDTPLDVSKEQHMATDKPGLAMRHKMAALLKAHGEEEYRVSE